MWFSLWFILLVVRCIKINLICMTQLTFYVARDFTPRSNHQFCYFKNLNRCSKLHLHCPSVYFLHFVTMMTQCGRSRSEKWTKDHAHRIARASYYLWTRERLQRTQNLFTPKRAQFSAQLNRSRCPVVMRHRVHSFLWSVHVRRLSNSTLAGDQHCDRRRRTCNQ